MKLISWNVNGLRAAMGKGFLEFAKEADPDILCIQETKMQEGQAEVPLDGYHQYWCSAEKKGYSGTAVFTKEEPVSVRCGIGIEEHDHEGRTITGRCVFLVELSLHRPQEQRGVAYRLFSGVRKSETGFEKGGDPDGRVRQRSLSGESGSGVVA